MNNFLDSRFQTIALTGTLFAIYLFSFLAMNEYIIAIGNTVLSNDPIMDFHLNLSFYWLAGLILILLPINQRTKSVIVYAHIFRLLFLHTITIGYLFLFSSDKGSEVISLDEMFYFLDGITLSSNEIGYVGSGLIKRINFLISEFLPINYFLNRTFFSFFAFTGLILIWKAIAEYYTKPFNVLLILLLFFPSLTFWSLNMGKGPLILLGLGIYFLGHLRLLRDFSFHSLCLFFLGILIIGLVRPWVVLIIGPGIILSALLDPRIRQSSKILSISLAIILIPFVLSTIVSLVIRGAPAGDDQIFSMEIIFSIINKFIAEGSTADVVNNPLVIATEVTKINSIADLINPSKMFSALFRPFPGEAGGSIGIVVGLESIFLLLFSIFTLVRGYVSKIRIDTVCIILISHIIFWSILYGAILEFNWGYLFRQKVIILPFLLSLLFLLNNKSSYSMP